MQQSEIQSAFFKSLQNASPQGYIRPKVKMLTVRGQGYQHQQKNEITSIKYSKLRQIIEDEVSGRLAPLIAKIQQLQNILNDQKSITKQNQVSSTQEELHFEDKSEEQIIEEGPMPIDSLEEGSQTGYWEPRRKKPSKKTTQVHKICDKKLCELDRVVVPPEHYGEWTAQRQIVKKIFQNRLKRQTKVILQNQKMMLVDFVDFGVQKLGLKKMETVNLAGISQSSYSRWKRNQI